MESKSLGPPSTEDHYVNEREVARRTTLSIAWLRLRRRDGGGPPFVKIGGKPGGRGGRVVYRWAAVQQWIEAQGGAEPSPAGGDGQAS